MDSERQLVKLTTLPVNKTVVFYSPVEGKDVLVRTGVISEGSSLLHALLHGYSKDYVKMEKDGRLHLAEKMKKSLAEKLDRKNWEKISNGLVAKIPFQDNITEILTDVYRYILSNKACKTSSGKKIVKVVLSNEDDKETYQLICELVDLKTLIATVLPKAYDSCADENLEKSQKLILDFCLVHLTQTLENLQSGDDQPAIGDDRIEFCLRKFEAMLSIVLSEADKKAYQTYLKNVKDVSFDVDAYTVGLLSERFNRDIYFLDAKSRVPYRVGDKESIKKRKSLVVIWIGGLHYEIVGRLLDDHRIQRDFDSDDPLVKRIYTFLYHPETVSARYPNLVPYLEEQEREKMGLTRSKSHNSASSESDSSESTSGSSGQTGSDSSASSASSESEPSRTPEKKREKPHRESRKRTPRKVGFTYKN